MIKTIKKILSNVMHPNQNDPVYHCKLLREEGCSHVDGPLCTYPLCSRLTEYMLATTSPLPTLTRLEIKNYYNFIGKLPKKYKNKPIYFRFEYGSGIGISVYVKCEDREEDITDYRNW